MPTALSNTGSLDKLARIRQLRAHGLNTPRIELIEVGTPVDEALRRHLRELAAGDERMTVRTYHSVDEVGRAKGPFVPEVPVDEAIAAVADLVGDWNVLFQEAIDVRDTLLAGNVILSGDGRGEYEVLRGTYRVRDVDDLPPGAESHVLTGRFDSPADVDDPWLCEAIERVLRSHLLDAVSPRADDAVVLELNVQRWPVGTRGEPILWWEWRPSSPRSSAGTPQVEPIERVESNDRFLSVGTAGLPLPPPGARATLGGKAAGLAAARSEGLPVPPAFVIATPVDPTAGAFEAELEGAIAALIDAGEEMLGRRPDDARFAVRSSPVHSMPGMLETKLDVPPTPAAVSAAIDEVLASWRSERARLYRQMHGIGEDDGLAVIVQQMALPDTDERSGSGVGFTRDPRTGEHRPVIEYVRGRGTPLVSGRLEPADLADLADELPAGRVELDRWLPILERVGGDVQEFEFAFERARPLLLQMRPARQTPVARVLSAYGLEREGLVDEAGAARLLDGLDLTRLERRRLRTDASPLAEARVASPGVAVGRIALSRAGVERIRRDDDPVVLLLDSVSTDDYGALREVRGVVARIGGVTSHAAVVALEAGIVALVGCAELSVGDESARFGEVRLAEGDWLSIDGDETGRIYSGQLDVEAAGERSQWAEALGWARKAERAS